METIGLKNLWHDIKNCLMHQYKVLADVVSPDRQISKGKHKEKGTIVSLNIT